LSFPGIAIRSDAEDVRPSIPGSQIRVSEKKGKRKENKRRWKRREEKTKE